MANRRMFAKSITNSSRFLMLSSSAQWLYFHLNMNADDDGFVEHFTVMRMLNADKKDLQDLEQSRFIEVFDDEVLQIIDWKENNHIRADRHIESKYVDKYNKKVDI